MKKKVIKFTVLAVFAFITGLNVYKAQTEVQLSDAQMKNIEALASGEAGTTPQPEKPDCLPEKDAQCWLPIVTPTETYYEVHVNQENYNEILP